MIKKDTSDGVHLVHVVLHGQHVELGHKTAQHKNYLLWGDTGGVGGESGDISEQQGGVVDDIGELEFHFVVLVKFGDHVGG